MGLVGLYMNLQLTTYMKKALFVRSTFADSACLPYLHVSSQWNQLRLSLELTVFVTRTKHVTCDL